MSGHVCPTLNPPQRLEGTASRVETIPSWTRRIKIRVSVTQTGHNFFLSLTQAIC